VIGQPEACDYCDGPCLPAAISLWKDPLGGDVFPDGTRRMDEFVICTMCIRLAVEAAVFQETAPPAAMPRVARELLRDAIDRYSNGVRTALEIEESMARALGEQRLSSSGLDQSGETR
jgi:hypothetical protein